MTAASLLRLFERKDDFQRDAHVRRADLRLLLLCDRPAASQEVHLLRALRRIRQAGACGLTICSEAAIAAAKSGAIEAEIERTRPNALIFSRFAQPPAQAICDFARARGLPIITHLDDFLLDVPADVGAKKAAAHMRPERIAAITATLENADLLYISTTPLLERIRAAGFAAPAIVSALQSCADNDELAQPPQDDAEIRIGYQGTSSHGPDLGMIVPAILAAMAARPSTTLTLFGTIAPPPELLELGPRLKRVAPASGYTEFLAKLCAQRWHIGLAPLRDTPFNSYRTYTKWTEYAIAGAMVLASDVPAYRDIIAGDAGLLARDDAWETLLLKAIDHTALRLRLAETAQTTLRTKLSLSLQEEQVLSVLRAAGVRT